MKCQNCGGPSTSTFCSPTCEDLGIAALYEAVVRTNTSDMKVQILCTQTMRDNKQLCHRCTQRLKKLITGKCNWCYERV
jgi:hypothetical protein